MITFADLQTRRLLLLNTAIMNARIARLAYPIVNQVLLS